MGKSQSSRAWIHEHVTDPYVRQAKKEGWRSRAAFKLLEMDDKDHLFHAGDTVVDLGATPGGWSQVAAKKVGEQGRVFALDVLEMQGINQVTFIQGDFCEDATLKRLEAALEGRRIKIILSDMAPNLSGIAATDQARGMNLAELALDFARHWLVPDGIFLVKVFQGAGYPAFLTAMREIFMSVATRKPKASRDRSAELYLLGRSLRPDD